MKSFPKFIYILFPILLLFSSFNGFSQEILKDTTNIKLVNAGKEIIAAAGYCALITIDDEGLARVRVMDPFALQDDFTVWFGTNSKSRKIDQIKKNANVTLYYLDIEASGYVTIRGTAQIINDPQEKEKHWKKEWKAFYPDYPKGYSLIKVTPKWMEVISEKHGILGDSITWQAPILHFDSGKK